MKLKEEIKVAIARRGTTLKKVCEELTEMTGKYLTKFGIVRLNLTKFKIFLKFLTMNLFVLIKSILLISDFFSVKITIY